MDSPKNNDGSQNNNNNSEIAIKSSKPISNLLKKNKIRKSNPDIFHFNLDSAFIYEPRYCSFHYTKLSNPNSMKPNQGELTYLKDIINNISNSKEINNDMIFVLPFFAEIMSEVIKVIPELDEKSLLIKNIIALSSNIGHISVRKITEKYNEIADLNNKPKISKSQVHRIIKNKLKYSYRKTIPKTHKLISEKYIKYSFFFLKIFLRSIKLNITPIYIDESGFTNLNTNLYTWRSEEQEIYTNFKKIEKINLILAASPKKIYYYTITNSSTDSIIFEKFIIDLINKITDEQIKNYLFVLDNASFHLTLNMFEIYNKKQLKVLFGVPYKSNFNMTELIFRYIKNYTYKKLYNNIELLKNDIKNIINDKKMNDTLPKLYKETLNSYFTYITKNNNKNLNK